jgi:hypothetical protein
LGHFGVCFGASRNSGSAAADVGIWLLADMIDWFTDVRFEGAEQTRPWPAGEVGK